MRQTLAKRRLAILTVFAFCSVAPRGAGDELSPSLRQQLRQPLHATWEGQQLAIVLQRIAATHGVAVWLDRRVDPHEHVTLRMRGEPLGTAFERLADQQDLGLATVEGILYLGPVVTAIELPTLYKQVLAQVSQTPRATQHRWTTPTELQWPRLSEPRDLLRRWLSQSGVALENESLVPHDLWAAQQLPDASLAARTTILLAGFDLTCELSSNGRSCRIAPVTRPLIVERRYRDLGEPLAQLQQKFPQARVTGDANGYTVSGPSEVHSTLRKLVNMGFREEDARSGDVSQRNQRRRFSLKLENQPVERVVAHLANQLGLEVKWAADLPQSHRERLTSCDVHEVELDELLDSLLDPVGLEFQRAGDRITIGKSPE